MKHEITIKKLNAIHVTAGNAENQTLALAFNTECMRLGYVMSKPLFERVASLSKQEVGDLYETVIAVLEKIKGADVTYEPMYPGFPEQVETAPYHELCANALLHYYSYGVWRPEYRKTARRVRFEPASCQELTPASATDHHRVFTEILASHDSIAEEDKKIVRWFIHRKPEVSIPEEIPFKENLCFVVAECMKAGRDCALVFKTATDVLRVITHLSGGDISLAENTRYKSLPRAQRRFFVKVLENVVREEDLKRHRKKWIRVFHALHVGEYSKSLFDLAAKVRDGKPLSSFYGRVEAAMTRKDLGCVLKLLGARPGEFARRIDHLLRVFDGDTRIIDSFGAVVDQVPTRILLQLSGNLKTRFVTRGKRIVFPKGRTQNAQIVMKRTIKLAAGQVMTLKQMIDATLRDRFSKLDPLDKVWIDPALKDCPLPAQQRSASASSAAVARGTRLPIGDKNTLRFFVYWVGRDIDLSATFHDKKFRVVDHISYTQLRNRKLKAYHSGDITNGRDGACEFIDVDIAAAVKSKLRYLTMNVLVYHGPSFRDHKTCFAGWMTRSFPKSNEIFDPRTVENRLDLDGSARNMIPVVFDLYERKAVWTDLATTMRTYHGGNNVESNRASIEDVLEAVVSNANKVSLFELFTLHAEGRGEIVDTIDSATTVFSMKEGTTPYCINKINAEFLA